MSQNPINILFNLRIICSFEFSRLFLTQKGLIYLTTFAVLWYFILNNAIVPLSTQIGPALTWPVPELELFWRISLYLFPILCILTAANQTAADRERGTLRFLVLRCSRDALFFGRFTAQLLIQMLLVVATLATTLLMALQRDGSLLTPGINSASLVAINLFFVLLPFTALLALLSAAINSARQVMTWAILIWSLSSAVISGLSHYWPTLSFLQTLIPGTQLSELAKLPQSQTLTLAYIPLLQSLVLLAAGRTVIARSSL